MKSKTDAMILQFKIIEQEWLKKIGAPVSELPEGVATAVACRVLLNSMPADEASNLIAVTEKRLVESSKSKTVEKKPASKTKSTKPKAKK